MARPINRLGLVLALWLSSCVAHFYEISPPPPPPPPPTEPPPGAQGSLAADVSAEPSNAAPSASSRSSQAPADAPAQGQAQAQAEPLPALPSHAPQYAPTPAEAPQASQWVRSYPDGQWVYTSSYGWIWVPADAATETVEGVPYAYLYTPHFGWTWYLSPWGWGTYHYGIWVTRPWRPVGWHHYWVAHPHVIVRLGRPHHDR
jgi:hypothetical protein